MTVFSMRKCVGALVLGMAVSMPMAAIAKTATGSAAPEFSVVDTHGEQYDLVRMKGKTVILEWTNADCPYVRKHYGANNMQAIQKDLVNADTVWLSVISSAPGKQGHVDALTANSLTTERGAAPSGVVLDPSGALGRHYDAKTTPHMYIIDPEGILVYQGAIDSNRSASPSTIPTATNYVRAAMADLAAGQPVQQKDTQPYGCSVKY